MNRPFEIGNKDIEHYYMSIQQSEVVGPPEIDMSFGLTSQSSYFQLLSSVISDKTGISWAV